MTSQLIISLERKIMAFEKMKFSSVANQQVAGERIQTWQYETEDEEAEVTGSNYFREMAQSLHVNDQLHVFQMEEGALARRYDLTVRVNETMDGPNLSAVLALPELADGTTHALDFLDLSAADTETITLPKSGNVVAAHAVFLGLVGDLSANIAVAVKSVTTPSTVSSGTMDGPLDYGQALELTAGAADPDTSFTVTVTPTNIPDGAGTLRIFLVTKDA
jgi:hypothetical protein